MRRQARPRKSVENDDEGLLPWLFPSDAQRKEQVNAEFRNAIRKHANVLAIII
jgi:hypothetical protein